VKPDASTIELTTAVTDRRVEIARQVLERTADPTR
jgi:hypothetical protein